MKIAVYGSASREISQETREKARNLGREIAARNNSLITGACPGLPYEAVEAAAENIRLGAPKAVGIIGYSPATNTDEHTQKFNFPVNGFTKLIFLPEEYKRREKGVCLKLRNIFSVEACDAAVFIAGRMGSLNEFTLAYDMGRNIGMLTKTGGFADMAKGLVDALGKPTSSKIIYEQDPVKLVRRLEELSAS